MTTPKKTRFTVRAATPHDLAACLALNPQQETQTVWQMGFQQDDDQHSRISFSPLRLPRPIQVDYPRNTAQLREDLHDMHGVLVAEAENLILGFAQVVMLGGDGGAWLRNWMVDVPWRRHRIGHALYTQACEWARRAEADRITAEATTRHHAAMRFYLKNGLRFCGFHDRYYADQAIAVFFGQAL